MDTTSPTHQVFTHIPNPPIGSTPIGTNLCNWFGKGSPASVFRLKGKNYATLQVMAGEHTASRCQLSRELMADELRALACALIDAAADIEANPAGGAL